MAGMLNAMPGSFARTRTCPHADCLDPNCDIDIDMLMDPCCAKDRRESRQAQKLMAKLNAWDPARQYSAFREHRHDQSILSLLAKRHRLKTFPLPTAAHDRRDIWARHHGTKKLAHTSASWLSGGLFQRLILLQAAPSLGQPRPNSRLVPVGWPHRPCFWHRRGRRATARLLGLCRATDRASTRT